MRGMRNDRKPDERWSNIQRFSLRIVEGFLVRARGDKRWSNIQRFSLRSAERERHYRVDRREALE